MYGRIPVKSYLVANYSSETSLAVGSYQEIEIAFKSPMSWDVSSLLDKAIKKQDSHYCSWSGRREVSIEMSDIPHLSVDELADLRRCVKRIKDSTPIDLVRNYKEITTGVRLGAWYTARYFGGQVCGHSDTTKEVFETVHFCTSDGLAPIDVFPTPPTQRSAWMAEIYESVIAEILACGDRAWLAEMQALNIATYNKRDHERQLGSLRCALQNRCNALGLQQGAGLRKRWVAAEDYRGQAAVNLWNCLIMSHASSKQWRVIRHAHNLRGKGMIELIMGPR